ncbi:MAG: ATP-dependent DNA helicase RecG [Candidatus Hydrogenedentes bacterium]|nr:ATP-dependent DNA helicase RecG [Candidatus Hydrogenedentota bacterium]
MGDITTNTAQARSIASGPRLSLDNPLTALPGVAEKRAEQLRALGLITVRDLLQHFPRTYQDRRVLTRIADVREGDTITVEAEVVKSRAIRLRRRLAMADLTLRDESGEIRAIWFGQDYLVRVLKPGSRGFFTGAAGAWKGLALRNPDYELHSGDEEDRLNSGRIVPVYRLTEGVSQRMLRRLVRTALDLVEPPEDPLPRALREAHAFPAAPDALRHAHFPDEIESGQLAKSRFAYEELLGIQLGVLTARAKRHLEHKRHRHVVDGPHLQALRAALPFTLTQGQRSAVADILGDMASHRPMVRLLQGDVGCGKTLVALHAIAAACDGGYQSALMAPTEILAEQHGIHLREHLEPLGLNVAVLTGSTGNAKAVRARIASGATSVIVGTHALLQESTAFHNLGLVIIDEQHRFGVVQRGALHAKGLDPELLHMTATPIPRTLAITVYGGMDLSIIEELPPGRAPVKTRRITPAKVPELYAYLRRQAAAGYQTYYVCPLVEESAAKQLTAVTTHFEELSAGPLSGLRTAMIHGRLPSSEKDEAMHRFKRGEIDVLFSTTVIEVGIDCPNATTMVIEDAAQFGLTQLHQLRGRVGRGPTQSYCFLLGKPATADGKRRLEILCESSSGFDIAEADLEMRGPGEFQGLRQAGLSDLRVADLVRDVRLLDAARRDAQRILEADPSLARPEHTLLSEAARRYEAINT